MRRAMVLTGGRRIPPWKKAEETDFIGFNACRKPAGELTGGFPLDLFFARRRPLPESALSPASKQPTQLPPYGIVVETLLEALLCLPEESTLLTR
jgi:hypothetical protein